MAGSYRNEGPYGSGGYGGPGIYQGSQQNDQVVTIYSEADPNYRLAATKDGIVLIFKNLEDPHQHWYKIDKSDFKDEEGCSGFILVNKATQQALGHGSDLGDAVMPKTFHQNSLDNSLLWSISKEVGHSGYSAIRTVTNIKLNLDADHGDKKHGGIKENNRLVIHSWNKQENQKWKIVPVANED